MMHILRSAPCFFLLIFHLMIYSSSLSSAILLTNFQNNVYPWPQATLPVNHEEIGIKSAVHLAPSPYLAAADRSSILICRILRISFSEIQYPKIAATISLWGNDQSQSPPQSPFFHLQKLWDIPCICSMA